MSGRGGFLALGECMVEMAPTAEGLYRRGFAGDTFNTAWYARRLLPPAWGVGYCTCVGTDTVSQQMLGFMAGEGVSTAAVRQVCDRTVGLYMIDLHDGERSFSYWRDQSAARLLAADEVWLRAVLAKPAMLHFSGITLAILGPEGRRRLCELLGEARAAGATVAFDTNLRPRLWQDRDEMRAGIALGASVADIVLPSFDEDGPLFADSSPAATAERYREGGARLVAVKNGGGALTLWQRDAATCEIPAIAVANPVDTTAAGDSFAAGLLSGLAQGRGAEDSARAAMALAARVIRAPGALVPEAL